MELIPDVEDELDAWRLKTRIPGEYEDQFDGRICQELPGHDGLPFFHPELAAMPENELRIGLTLGVDWFSYHRSLISPSHSSCPMSCNIINLSPSSRYRASNLLLVGILPGPQEQDPEEVQHFLDLLVDELLVLYHQGFRVVTKRCPDGRLVRVVLVGVICDKPAAHKIGGYGSHSHTFFCTLCWIEKSKRASEEAFKAGGMFLLTSLRRLSLITMTGFRPRTNEQHRQKQAEFLRCSTKAAKTQFVKEHATRWSALSRLPYFDFPRMIVVDPMHNLFLGK